MNNTAWTDEAYAGILHYKALMSQGYTFRRYEDSEFVLISKYDFADMRGCIRYLLNLSLDIGRKLEKLENKIKKS